MAEKVVGRPKGCNNPPGGGACKKKHRNGGADCKHCRAVDKPK